MNDHNAVCLHPESILAILRGHKTQMRRPFLPQPPARFVWPLFDASGCGWFFDGDPEGSDYYPKSNSGLMLDVGKPGDEIWVKEGWKAVKPVQARPPAQLAVSYQADGQYCLFKDSEHRFPEHWLSGEPLRAEDMPIWASRIVLRIEAITVHRLQDMTEEDAVEEGFQADGDTSALGNLKATWAQRILLPSLQWEANPWAWAVSFTVMRTTVWYRDTDEWGIQPV